MYVAVAGTITNTLYCPSASATNYAQDRTFGVEYYVGNSYFTTLHAGGNTRSAYVTGYGNPG